MALAHYCTLSVARITVEGWFLLTCGFLMGAGCQVHLEGGESRGVSGGLPRPRRQLAHRQQPVCIQPQARLLPPM